MQTSEVTASIRAIKERLTSAERSRAATAAGVEQASQALAQAEETLRELGFDPTKPLAPQITTVLQRADKSLTKIEKEIGDARRQLGTDAD